MAPPPPPNGVPSNDNRGTDSITIPTPWGTPFIARGTLVILVLLILAGGYMTWALNDMRRQEHAQIIEALRQGDQTVSDLIIYQACLTKLNLFVATSKDPTNLQLREMPAELWSCLPKFLADKGKQQ